MSDTSQPRRSGRHKLAIVMTVISLIVAFLLIANRQYVVDQVSAWQYAPSAKVAALAERSGMSDTGKFYFYASHPSIEGTQAFDDKCDRKEQSTAILGCYNGHFIYIFDVQNEKLDGIQEVTAAHEMLHAAYDRLSEDELKKVNSLLEEEYTKLKGDEKLAERMAFYARTEPGERDNELHSLIGTEVASVSPALEEHYKRYFVDRSKIVALHAKYEKVFTDIQNRAESLSLRVTQLGDQIEADTIEYNKSVTELNQDIVTFKARAENGGFSSRSEYDMAYNDLLSRSQRLDSEQAAIRTKLAQYEKLRKDLQAVAGQSQALQKSIDSSLAPAPNL